MTNKTIRFHYPILVLMTLLLVLMTLFRVAGKDHPTLYRVAWKNPSTGYVGHGNWFKDYQLVRTGVYKANITSLSINHWIEKKDVDNKSLTPQPSKSRTASQKIWVDVNEHTESIDDLGRE